MTRLWHMRFTHVGEKVLHSLVRELQKGAFLQNMNFVIIVGNESRLK